MAFFCFWWSVVLTLLPRILRPSSHRILFPLAGYTHRARNRLSTRSLGADGDDAYAVAGLSWHLRAVGRCWGGRVRRLGLKHGGEEEGEDVEGVRVGGDSGLLRG